jgi:hypothetical protein
MSEGILAVTHMHSYPDPQKHTRTRVLEQGTVGILHKGQ